MKEETIICEGCEKDFLMRLSFITEDAFWLCLKCFEEAEEESKLRVVK